MRARREPEQIPASKIEGKCILMFRSGVREDSKSNEMTLDVFRTVTANGTLTVNKPVMLYLSAAGVLMGINSAVVANMDPDAWGVATETVTTGLRCRVQIFGAMTVASGGTAGQLVLSITKDGVITDAAAADTGLIGLAVSTAAGTLTKYRL